MSFNGSGTYTLPGSPLNTGDVVSATENNNFRNDVAGAFNKALCRDGQAVPTSNLPMGNFKLTGLAAGTNAGDSVRYEQVTSAVAITGGTIANTSITGGSVSSLTTDIAIADGGTGASTAANARTNLGLGGLAVLNTVGTAQIDNLAVGTAQIANNAVTTGKLASSAVTATELASDAVTTIKILNANVTPAKLSQPLTKETAKASTSGQTVEFTGIPSWVNRITVMFNGVSGTGTSYCIIQGGTTSGYETSSYVCNGCNLGAGASASATTIAFTNGFPISASSLGAANETLIGTLVHIGSNVWLWNTTGTLDATATITWGVGKKSLTGTLDRLRIALSTSTTTMAGTDTFDAGSFNILYE